MRTTLLLLLLTLPTLARQPNIAVILSDDQGYADPLKTTDPRNSPPGIQTAEGQHHSPDDA
jgi:hypothetical protein